MERAPSAPAHEAPPQVDPGRATAPRPETDPAATVAGAYERGRADLTRLEKNLAAGARAAPAQGFDARAGPA